jgi:UBX domain-containing protein 1
VVVREEGKGVVVERTSINTLFDVDQSLPATSVQIRLANGTKYAFYLFNFIRLHFVFCAFCFIDFFLVFRIVCRMNLTHKVQDIRNFINPYVIPPSMFKLY